MNQSSVSPRLDLVAGRPVTTSLNVAEVFGKQHQHVLRAIREIDVPEDFAASNFGRGSYLDDNGQARPMYHITRDGFTLLAMGFTGKQAMQFKLAYIAAFNAMEAELVNQDRPGRSAKDVAIRYTLDLTKIVLNPTSKSLRVLGRLAGLDVDDLVQRLQDEAATASDEHIKPVLDHFAAAWIVPDEEGKVAFATLYTAFLDWYTENWSSNLSRVPSKKAVSMWLSRAGYSTGKPSGIATVYGLRLTSKEVQA